MKAVWNIKEKGIFYFLMFEEKEHYVAVCLNLDIIEYGKDKIELWKSIIEAAFGYLEAVRKKNLSDELLNTIAPKKYWDMFDKAQQVKKVRERIKSLKESSKKPSVSKQELRKALFLQTLQRSYIDKIPSSSR